MTRRNPRSNRSPFEAVLCLTGVLALWWAVENQTIALLLIQKPHLILPYLIQELGFFWVITGAVGILALLWFLLVISVPASNILRGAKIVPSSKLKTILKRQPQPQNQPQMELAGMPIPSTYENRGIFAAGSPGSGKTQAISQLVATLKQRTDFRAIIFDRNGELLEKLYDPTKDIIFNPHDARSCYWTHIHEKAQPATIAAGLIPMESTREPFFSNAGRAVMTELFRKTRSNAELLELLQGDAEQLKAFLAGTLAYRYLEEAKVATSVLSTAANYCQFYESLIVPQAKAISFYQWGASNSAKWIFVTLNEDDAELFKPLYSLAFELMLKGLLSNQQRSRKTAIVIDELGALNQLPSLNRLLSESRKFLGCPILGTQTEAQITKIYGKEDTRILLQGAKTKLILNCSDPQTAETMAQIIGKQERVDFTNNHNRSHNYSGKGAGHGSSEGESEQIREVYAVMPSQLQDLPDLTGYLKISGLPAAQVRLKVQHFPVQAERFIPRSQVPTQNTADHPTSTLSIEKADSIQEQWRRLRSQTFRNQE